MDKEADKEIERIERTQEALRESIEEAKRLSEDAQTLLRKHRRKLESGSD